MLAAALIALRAVVRFREGVGVSRIVAGEDVGFFDKTGNRAGVVVVVVAVLAARARESV